ncbi:UNVERIFIED_CONTAM: hypothetical protein HDU68_006949 [Siphonaria sp. JEL0065]|nr:hypothetical protein HDU68_006949 [Siphonaria sp. JEL0065]
MEAFETLDGLDLDSVTQASVPQSLLPQSLPTSLLISTDADLRPPLPPKPRIQNTTSTTATMTRTDASLPPSPAVLLAELVDYACVMLPILFEVDLDNLNINVPPQPPPQIKQLESFWSLPHSACLPFSSSSSASFDFDAVSNLALSNSLFLHESNINAFNPMRFFLDPFYLYNPASRPQTPKSTKSTASATATNSPSSHNLTNSQSHMLPPPILSMISSTATITTSAPSIAQQPIITNNPPPPPLKQFITKLLKRTQLSHSTFLHALYLLHNLHHLHPTLRTPSTSSPSTAPPQTNNHHPANLIHKLLLGTLIISAKVLYDDTYDNQAWKAVAQGICTTVTDVNLLERATLGVLQFRVGACVGRLEWRRFLECVCDGIEEFVCNAKEGICLGKTVSGCIVCRFDNPAFNDNWLVAPTTPIREDEKATPLPTAPPLFSLFGRTGNNAKTRSTFLGTVPPPPPPSTNTTSSGQEQQEQEHQQLHQYLDTYLERIQSARKQQLQQNQTTTVTSSHNKRDLLKEVIYADTESLVNSCDYTSTITKNRPILLSPPATTTSTLDGSGEKGVTDGSKRAEVVAVAEAALAAEATLLPEMEESVRMNVFRSHVYWNLHGGKGGSRMWNIGDEGGVGGGGGISNVDSAVELMAGFSPFSTGGDGGSGFGGGGGGGGGAGSGEWQEIDGMMRYNREDDGGAGEEEDEFQILDDSVPGGGIARENFWNGVLSHRSDSGQGGIEDEDYPSCGLSTSVSSQDEKEGNGASLLQFGSFSEDIVDLAASRFVLEDD